MWISRVNFHRNGKQISICVTVDPVGRNSGWKGYFLLNLSQKLSSATAEQHSEGWIKKNTSKKQKTVQPTSFPWNHSNILSLSEIHADSFPVPLKQFSLQWNSLSSGGILSLQLQPTASLAGHSRLNSREAGNMKSWDAWPDFKLNVVSSRIVTFK